ncbi:hypothetical protein ACFY3B_19345 [Micromonospora parva]|uniref:Uncharacterized protein n=1 Tax=Micromonospora parva TaxID=1464048 RepID=A0ABW6VVU0_9ACTN
MSAPQTATTPWQAGEHPADWAYRTGRVTVESREWWRTEYDGNPAEVGEWLAMLVPVLADPRVANLVRSAERQQRSAQATAHADFVALFPPTRQPTPGELGPYAHLFPPRDDGPDDLGEFSQLFPPTR